jgi:hypothetical protein
MKACYDHLPNSAGFQEGDRVWLYHLTGTRWSPRSVMSSTGSSDMLGLSWLWLPGGYLEGAVLWELSMVGSHCVDCACPSFGLGWFRNWLANEKDRDHVNVLDCTIQVLCLHEGRKQQREWSVLLGLSSAQSWVSQTSVQNSWVEFEASTVLWPVVLLWCQSE